MQYNGLRCEQISSHEPRPEVLRELQELSVAIFSPYFSTTEHNHPSFDFSEWQRRLTFSHSVVYYATKSETDKPLGFFFAHPRTQPEIGHELLHIWLVGVDPDSRGLGIFPFLMDRMKQHARNCGYSELTICTRPKQFQKMYRILGEHGWQEVAWRLMEDGELQQVLMKLSI